MAGKKKDGKRQEADWDLCPKGALSALSGKLQGRKRRRRFLQFAGALSLAVVGGGVAVGLGLFLRRQPDDGMKDFNPDDGMKDFNFGEITCTEVLQNAQAFAMGQIQEPLLGKMRVHIAQCPKCGPLIRNMPMPKKAEG